jgi:ubiquinone/menaquinone biosynthesis C-methylase UbiE
MHDLYRARARDEEVEMTCAAQAAELLTTLVSPGDIILDVGCGSGWFFHSLRRRNVEVEYLGMDKTKSFILIGREELSRFGVDPDRLMVGAVEYLEGSADHVVCMNVLSNIDNWHRGLDRMAAVAGKTLILRESIGDVSEYLLVTDNFLDQGSDLKVHVNRYSFDEIVEFLGERGFKVERVLDARTQGLGEDVIGYPHYWTFLVCRRNTESS